MSRIRLIAPCAEVRALDDSLERELGLSALELMEVAGAGCFLLMRSLAEASRSMVVVAGPGNNGGDGFVVARYSASAGIPTSVFAMRPPAADSPSRAQLERLGRFEVAVSTGDLRALDQALSDPAALVVDALFGTGVTQPLRPEALGWIDAVNRARGTIVSIDVPSGLDGDTGAAQSGCVRAASTLTIGAIKPGLLSTQGARHAGNIELVPLPYPPALVRHLRRLDS